MKKLLMVMVFLISTLGAPSAYAFDLVIDIPAIIQFVLKKVGDVSHQVKEVAHQVSTEVADAVAAAKRVEQIQQLITTYDQIVEAYNAVTEVRDTAGGVISSAVGMVDGATMMEYVELDKDGNVKTDKDGNVIKKPGMAFLPDSYEDGLRRVVNKGGNSTFLDEYSAPVRKYVEDMTDYNTDDKTELNKAQAVYNRSLAALAYQHATQRNTKIQSMIGEIKGAGEDKDVQDLQANMLGYQATLQNEQLKLQSLILLQQAQLNVEQQRTKQRRTEMMKVTIDPATVIAAGVAWAF
jgi:hypothetical protein